MTITISAKVIRASQATLYLLNFFTFDAIDAQQLGIKCASRKFLMKRPQSFVSNIIIFQTVFISQKRISRDVFMYIVHIKN